MNTGTAWITMLLVSGQQLLTGPYPDVRTAITYLHETYPDSRELVAFIVTTDGPQAVDKDVQASLESHAVEIRKEWSNGRS